MTTQVIHGDCLEVMRDMSDGSFDMVFTSPPYNMGEPTPGGGGVRRGSDGKQKKLAGGYGGYDDTMPYTSYVLWQKEVLAECWRLLADDGAIYYNHKPRPTMQGVRLPTDLNPNLPLRQVIIWYQGDGYAVNIAAYQGVCEWILVLAKPDFRLKGYTASAYTDVWKIQRERNNPHPAPFPVELPLRALQTTNAQRVLDPFCGSGTTGVACLMTGRDFVGIDNSEVYCEMARTRLRRSEGLGFTASFLADLEATA